MKFLKDKKVRVRRSSFDELPPDPPAPKKEKPTLKPWQIADAKRLEALWLAKGKPYYSSQDIFGRKFEIGSAQMVWQYVKGVRPLNVAVAVKFAKGLNCPVGDFSPTLAEELHRLAATVVKKKVEQAEFDQIDDIKAKMTPLQRSSWIDFGLFLLKQSDNEIENLEVTHTPAYSDKSYVWTAQIDPAATSFTPPKSSDE
ncbi:MAG: hypothetical protein RL661_892 [Pseudomonadota bacterium]